MIKNSIAKPLMDPNVSTIFYPPNHPLQQHSTTLNQPVSLLIFFNSDNEASTFSDRLNDIPELHKQRIEHIPVLLIHAPLHPKLRSMLLSDESVIQISLLQGGAEELSDSEQAILLRPSEDYPLISNWWNNGYLGKNSIIGILDSGIAADHPSLQGKHLIIRTEKGSLYDQFQHGVRTPHGTGIACIYAGAPNPSFPNEIGIAPETQTIITALAGEGEGNVEDLMQTLSSLDWMLHRAGSRPDVINYSFGNGPTHCTHCPDWSGLAKIVDYVVHEYQILWIKSAGNGGYIEEKNAAPYAGTMTVPADNYNGLTVANINPNSKHRQLHTLRFTSSRGPTLLGRKKPDISAPGNNTRTCAPDPLTYFFSYTQGMDYHDGYRLMGGTSSAAPHVGAAALLLHDAGIHSPMAKKALLINSADAYTDGHEASPDDPIHPSSPKAHHPVIGSEWNRSYGWGYLNMQKAYDERKYLIEEQLSTESPEQEYHCVLPMGGKLTLVHERRVGFHQHQPWALSALSLTLIDRDTGAVIMIDDSPQDTVHQVGNMTKKPLNALIKVRLLSTKIDGAPVESFALAASVPFIKR